MSGAEPDGQKRSLEEASGEAEMFVIHTVVRATGGVSPCFLYRGLRGRDGERAHKRRNVGFPSRDDGLDAEMRLGDGDQVVPNYTSQPAPAAEAGMLTLYISFEEASPSPKLLQGARSRLQSVAPYRLCLRDASDELLVSYRGLPTQVQTDEQQCLARWGPACIAFPSLHDLRHFASCLKRVVVLPADLSSRMPTATAPAPARGTPNPVAAQLQLQAPLPPPPPHWAGLAAHALASPPQRPNAPLPAAGALQQRESEREGDWFCMPPALLWELATTPPAAELPPLATPPPLNRCALSGGGAASRAPAAAILPNPVPFVLPAPAQRQSFPEAVPSAVASAIAMLEAGVLAGRSSIW